MLSYGVILYVDLTPVTLKFWFYRFFIPFVSFRTSVSDSKRHFYLLFMFFYNPSSFLTLVYAFNVLQNSKLLVKAYN